MSKFIIKFEIPSRCTYGITCQSEPLPQWAMADFIQFLTDSNYTLLGVETVEECEPEAVYVPEPGDEVEEMDEEELCAEDIVEMEWDEEPEEEIMEEE